MRQSNLFIILILVSFFTNAEEFEFSIVEEDTKVNFDNSSAEKEKINIPLYGKISFDLGYQIGSEKRWITLGPYAQLIFNEQTDYGQFYSEATVRNNYAYKKEKDTKKTQDHYQLDSVIREIYLKKAFVDTTITLGKSIVTWGKADLLTVIDVVSPIDNASSLFAKPEEVKIGQNVIKFDIYKDNNEFNFIFVPKAINNTQIEPGHPYAPTLSFTPEDNIKDKNSEWVMRLHKTHNNWEFSTIVGDIHQRDPVYFDKEQTWQKNKALGFAFNYSYDPFLLKTEALYIKNRPMQKLDFDGFQTKDYYKTMFGFDYANQNFGNWTLEFLIESPIDKDTSTLYGDRSKTAAIAWSDTFLNDDLNMSATFITTDTLKNHISRLGADYKINDNWSINTKITNINSSSPVSSFASLSNFDRIDIGLDYNFDLTN